MNDNIVDIVGRNNQAVSVLNVVDLKDSTQPISGGNLPVGLREAQSIEDGGSTSCNFGTDRDSVRGGAYKGNGNVYISIPWLLTTDTISVHEGSDVPTCTTDGVLDIVLDDIVFDITISRAEVVLAHYKAQEKSGNKAIDSSGNDNHGDIMNLYPDFHGDQDVISYFDNEGGIISDGVSYYYDTFGTELIPVGVYIPLDNSVTLPPFKTIAYDITGNRVDAEYIGRCPSRAKFVDGNCFRGNTKTFIDLGDNVTLSGNWKISFYTRKEAVGYYHLMSMKSSTVTDTSIVDTSSANYLLYDNSGNLLIYHDLGLFENNMEKVGVPVYIEFESTGLKLYARGKKYINGKWTTLSNFEFDIQNAEVAYGYLGREGRHDRYYAGTLADVIYELEGVKIKYLTLSEEIKTPENHTYLDVSGVVGVPNGNHARLVNGSLVNNGTITKDGEYSQLGYNIDGVTGQQIPALASDITKDALGNPITNPQDSKSFLEGCKLQHDQMARVVQADTNNFWFDINGAPISKEVSDFTDNEADQIFSDVSEIDKVSNIRTHTEALTGRQLEIEKRLTNN